MSIFPPFFILLFLVLTGCSGGKVRPEPETSLSLTIIADSDINMSSCNSSSLPIDAAPLQLRMYELQSTELLGNADFMDLYQQDAAILQGALVKKHQLPTVWPNTNSQQSWQLDKATRFVTVFAEFICYQSAIWVATEAIFPGRHNPMTLQITGNRLRFSPGQFLASDDSPKYPLQQPEQQPEQHPERPYGSQI